MMEQLSLRMFRKKQFQESKKKGNKKFWVSPNLLRKKKGATDGIAEHALALTTALAASIAGVEDIVQRTTEKSKKEGQVSKNQQQDPMMKYVYDNIIGKDLVYDGPFGKRTVVYCDYTASGKAIKFIEDYIRNQVLPYYGNTHTTTTVSSLQTSSLRSEAKQIIRKCTNATEDDAVIFVSSGSTGAISKLIHGLDLKDSPVVFISPFEHHSNLLPWLEVGAEIVYGEENSIGMLDLIQLEENLKKYSTLGRPLIGSFSAASNITGILNDTEAIATIMHSYNGYAFFDYATAGPYVELDMNPNTVDEKKCSLSYKDAIFCSVHKFVGGPGTPGLLIAKKHVFTNPVPSGVGGGTVLFVTHKKHHYIKDIEEREEGGTPAIVESIRAGLVFQLKQEVSPKNIMTQELRLVEMAYDKWDAIPNLHILGKSAADRLPIFSLVFEHPQTKRFLHHNFVSSLLNDLFGIQARGGCACAGPYAEDLLGIDNELAVSITEALLGDYSSWTKHFKEHDLKQLEGKSYSILKPGFTRLNLPFFFNMEIINYILEAVVFVAEHGWKFLPMYEMNPNTGDFTHRKSQALANISHLTDVKYLVNGEYKEVVQKEKVETVPILSESLRQANEYCQKYCKTVKKENFLPSDVFIPASLDDVMRWFITPAEAHALLKGGNIPSAQKQIFYPRQSITLDSKRLQRTRIKSGLAKVKFCNCPVKKGRHAMANPCKIFAETNNKNIEVVNNNITSTNISETKSQKEEGKDGFSITLVAS